jgi:hypothetical protein
VGGAAQALDAIRPARFPLAGVGNKADPASDEGDTYLASTELLWHQHQPAVGLLAVLTVV